MGNKNTLQSSIPSKFILDFPIYTLSLQSTKNSMKVNDYFHEFEDFHRIINFDLFVTPGSDQQVQYCLSYRHLQPQRKGDKYLTLDCLEFIRDFPSYIN